MYTKQSLRKGSVLDGLILTLRHEGETSKSTAMSANPKWIADEKLAKLGTVTPPSDGNHSTPNYMLPKTYNGLLDSSPKPGKLPP